MWCLEVIIALNENYDREIKKKIEKNAKTEKPAPNVEKQCFDVRKRAI